MYTAMTMPLLLGMSLLVVDGSRVNLARSQARDVADAVALYAASGVTTGTAASVRLRAVQAAADNKIDGTTVVLDPIQDVEFGVWDSEGSTFSVMPPGLESGATAVRITVHRDKSRGSQIPLTFGKVYGLSGVNVAASAIASIGKVASLDVPGKASPWLAGLPNGTALAMGSRNPQPSTAPNCSPVTFPASGGTTLHFASVSGTTSWNGSGGFSGAGSAGPDGDTSTISQQPGAFGINSTKAPLGALMGIFLDNNRPDSTAMNGTVPDFSTAASRNFSSLTPQLKQVFFIGNGLDAAGSLQSFTAPPGATRLFIGFMDEKGWWWDNVGSVQLTVVEGTHSILVK